VVPGLAAGGFGAAAVLVVVGAGVPIGFASFGGVAAGVVAAGVVVAVVAAGVGAAVPPVPPATAPVAAGVVSAALAPHEPCAEHEACPPGAAVVVDSVGDAAGLSPPPQATTAEVPRRASVDAMFVSERFGRMR
jgi:hypothetical protein